MDIRDSESCAHVRQASLWCQRRLRRRFARTDQHVNKHRNSPLPRQGAPQHFALIVTALAEPFSREGNGHQRPRSVGTRPDRSHCRRQVVGDPGQAAVFQRVDRLLCSLGEPGRRSHRFQRSWPLVTQAAGAEVWLRLTAALAPGWTHGAPALAAKRTDDAMSVAAAEQRMTRQTLSRKEELFERRAKHAARD